MILSKPIQQIYFGLIQLKKKKSLISQKKIKMLYQDNRGIPFFPLLFYFKIGLEMEKKDVLSPEIPLSETFN